jgi:hypothetical protein
VKILAHAVIAAVVNEDDGPDVVQAGTDSMLAWLASIDMEPGDEVVVVRGRE